MFKVKLINFILSFHWFLKITSVFEIKLSSVAPFGISYIYNIFLMFLTHRLLIAEVWTGHCTVFKL